MMLRNRHDIVCSGSFEQANPCICVKPFCLKHWDKIFVTEIFMSTIGLHMVSKFRLIGIIHIPGIPFISESWHRINAPMNKNSQLCFSIPTGCFMVAKGLPVSTKWALCDYLIDLLQIGLKFHCYPSLYDRVVVFPVPLQGHTLLSISGDRIVIFSHFFHFRKRLPE